MNVPVKMAPIVNLGGSLSLTTSNEISTTPATYLTDKTMITDPILFSTNEPIEVAKNQVFSRVLLRSLNCSDQLISQFETCIEFKPSLSPFLCETKCEPSTQMPDDELEKWIEMKSRVFIGDSSFGVNTLAFVNEPVESERTMIEDFPWISLADLQDFFGIYKDTMSKRNP